MAVIPPKDIPLNCMMLVRIRPKVTETKPQRHRDYIQISLQFKNQESSARSLCLCASVVEQSLDTGYNYIMKTVCFYGNTT